MMAGHLGASQPHNDVLLLEGQTIRHDVGELTFRQQDADDRRRFPWPVTPGPN